MTDIQKLRLKLRESGFDAAVIISGVNRRYITGFNSTAGMVVVTDRTLEFYTDSRYIEAAWSTLPGVEVREVKGAGDYEKFAKEALEGAGTIGMEDGVLSYASYMQYNQAFGGRVKGLGTLLVDLRAVKSEEELKLIIKAQRISEKAFEEVLPLIRPGITEREIAAELVYRCMKFGGEKPSFDPIVIGGTRTSMPHGETSGYAIRNGDMIIMDFGFQYRGYCSDMTRTVALGCVTGEMRKVYNVVLQAQLAGIARTTAGIPGRDIHNAGHQVIKDAGYGDYFTHNFSHGIGLEIHESPRMSLQSEEGIPAGAVISAEPGIYLPGKFGVRIEDMLYIREGGCDNLTKTPKKLIIL